MKSDPRKWPAAAKILAGLAIGALLGLVLPKPGSSALVDRSIEIGGVGGDLWLAALKMTILPLVFSLIATMFFRSHGIRQGSLVARRTVGAVVFFYTFSAICGVVFTSVLLDLFPIGEGMATALRATGGEATAAPLTFPDMIRGMVPTNIVAAMTGPSLLPVLVFAVLFGAALSKVTNDEHRLPLVNGLRGLAEAMFILIGWVLALAPFGVALLVARTAHVHGTDILVGLAHYTALLIAALIALIISVCLIAILVARSPVSAFFRAMLPTQAVAFGTQSSLACLPLILKSCDVLGLRKSTSEISVPVAVTLMRMSAPMAHVFITAYAATVYGIPLGLTAMLLAGLLGALIEAGSAGIPSTATFVAVRAPVFAVFGIPLDIAVLFLVVETIVDAFRTTCNVTADVTAVALVDRRLPADPVPSDQ